MILIVEAASKNREMLRKVLEEAGEAVAEAADEAAAEAVVREEPDIHVAFIDLAGLSPRVWGLCRFLADRKVPTVIILPRENREARLSAMASGARAVLVKPLVMREFVPFVKSLAGRA